ncbi:MAG: tetratricopeptide repeat protein [Pseudomonadota bacterium]
MAQDERLQEALNKQCEGRYREAEELYLRVLRDRPGDFDANRLIATNYAEQGKVDEALHYFVRALAIDPNRPAIQCLTADFYMQKGMKEQAYPHYHKAMQLDPGMTRPYYGLGYILWQSQRFDEAEHYFRRALQLDPDYADVCFALGSVLKERARNSEALDYLKRARTLDARYDTEYTRFMIAAVEGQTPARPPDEYVTTLFDGYAEKFEQHLAGNLGYTIPAQLRALLPADARFANVLDLGCGTGLCALEFRQASGHLTGIDIAPKMIEEARKKQLYDELHASDINAFLARTPRRYDLFIAADVFIYVGALEQVFANIRDKAQPGAWFVFSVEHADGDGFHLTGSVRYAHSRRYIEGLARQHGFAIQESKPVEIRKERGAWITGEIYRLRLEAAG